MRTIPTEETAGVDLAALTGERDRLAAEKAELHDRLLRRQADFENFRKRAEKDRSDFVQFAGMEFVREMLPILDDFDRALNLESAEHQLRERYRADLCAPVRILKENGARADGYHGKDFRSESASGRRTR